MYLDHRNTNRDQWNFTYSGDNLLEASCRKYEYFTNEEKRLRNQLADLLKDESVKANDKRMDELKREVENAATERERCSVFKHEFHRNPNADYRLGIGDVVYFGLND